VLKFLITNNQLRKEINNLKISIGYAEGRILYLEQVYEMSRRENTNLRFKNNELYIESLKNANEIERLTKEVNKAPQNDRTCPK